MSDVEDSAESDTAIPGGGRTLGGSGVPSRPVASSSTEPTVSTSRSGPQRAAAPVQRGVAGARTLRDIQGDSHAGHGHDDDDDEEDFFAGGEKSGLAVTNPNNPRDQIESMLDRARR